MFGQYTKTITALVTGLIGWAASVVTSNAVQITAGEWVQLATVVAVTLGVYSFANKE